MIGMSQIRRKLYTGIAIGAAVGVVGIGLTLWWGISTIKSYEAGTNESYNEKYTQELCVLNQDVIQGQTITADMLSLVRVHIGTVPNGAINNMSGAIGQVARYNIGTYTPLTSNMLTTEILDKDIRDQEINTILMPSDLVEGDFVDIRIMFSNGTDYIVLAGKQVNQISGQTMWFSLKEDERLILNSAVIDSFLNEGSKLYATKYSDPEAQTILELERDEIVRGQLAELIKEELPELSTIAGLEEEIGTEEFVEETLEEGETIEDVSQVNPYVEKVLNFIIKYNNLTSSTSQTVTTYQPNDEVISAMRGNANISTEATDKLSEEIRINIENLNTQYESENEMKLSNVTSGAEAAISEQESQRQELLGVGI